VEVARSAMIAHAMTVLPDPGGATRTPSSWASITPTATACSGFSVAVNTTSISEPGFADVGDDHPGAGPLNDGRDGMPQSTGQHEMVVECDVITTDEPRSVPSGLTQALQFVELRVRH
jgi:hypothetical protein